MTATGVVTGPDRAAWLQRRRNGIGGSDAAAVVGMHPWFSAYGLYLDKRGELTADAEPTEPMRWGILLEEVVAREWSVRNEQPIKRFPPYDPVNILAHPEHPHMLANLDGYVLRSDYAEEGDVHPVAVLEVKTASGWSANDWDEGTPQHVHIQCQHQMAVTGLDRAEVACLIGGCRFVQDTIHRDDALIDALIRAEDRFWQQVLAGQPPAVDSHRNTTDVLKARWQETLDDAVELGSDGVAMVQERHSAKAEATLACDRLTLAENRIREAMGEHEMATVFGEIAATWKPDKAGCRRLIVKEIL